MPQEPLERTIEKLTDQNEQLKQQLREQQRINRELSAEIIELRGELATQASFAYISSGVHDRVTKTVRKLNRDLAWAQADIKRLEGSILQNVEFARQEYEKTARQYHKLRESLGEDYFSQNALAAASQLPAATTIEVRTNIIEKAKRRIQEQYGIDELTLDPYDHPGYCFPVAGEYNSQNGVISNMIALHLQAYGMANDPNLIAPSPS